MIDVLIITRDERQNLPFCLEALDGWTREVFVVDSGSTDGTVDIATQAGATVVHHDWPGYAAQKNWALENLPLQADWVLIIDADEIVTPELRDAMSQVADRPVDEVNESAFFVNRLTFFLGRPIRHCGYFPSWNIRLFKRGTARYENRQVHEHMIVQGKAGYLKPPMHHIDRRGIEHFIRKHNRYSSLEANQLYREITIPGRHLDGPVLDRHASRNRWVKRNMIHRLPMPGLWRFAYMYFLKLGFLDGAAGLTFCGLISQYDGWVSLKLRELLRQSNDSGQVDHDPQPASESQGITNWNISTAPEPTEPFRCHTSAGPAVRGWYTKREKAGRFLWYIARSTLFRFSPRRADGFRAWLLRRFGARIGPNVVIRSTCNVEIPWNLTMGDGAVLGEHAIIYNLDKITIEACASVSQYAYLCGGTHDHTRDDMPLYRVPIRIGRRAWVCADAFVGPGVVVGPGSVVGARSSVLRDVAPWTIVAGNPAREIREREIRMVVDPEDRARENSPQVVEQNRKTPATLDQPVVVPLTVNDRPVRVAYVSWYDPNDVGNWSGTSYHIAQCLRMQGIDVQVVGRLRRQYAPFNILKYLVNTYVRRLNDHPQRDPGYLKYYGQQLQRRLADMDVDAVVSPGGYVLPYLETDLPVIMWADATFDNLINYYEKFSNLSARTIRNGHDAEQRSLDRSDLVLMSCQWAIDNAVDRYGIDRSKTKLVQFGANFPKTVQPEEVDQVIDARSPDHCHLLFVGVDWHRKGAELSVQVAEQLKKEGVRATLHLVGVEPPAGRQLPDNVHAMGFISKRDPAGVRQLAQLFKQAHFFVLPTRADCTPIVYGEAASFAVPSLATKTGGVPSVVAEGHSGHLFDLDAGPEPYVQCIKRYMADREAYRQLARSSYQQYVARLNWGAAGRSVREALIDLIRRHKDSPKASE